MTALTAHSRVAFAGSIIAASLLLASCSAGTSQSDGAAGVSGAGVSGAVVQGMPAEAPLAADGSAKTVGSALQPQVVRTASVTLSADDVAPVSAKVKELFTRDRGSITAEDTQLAQDQQRSTITGQVPASSLDSFIASVSRLADVESVSTSAYDVTSQAVDLDARIASLTSSIARLRQLMTDAANVSDLLAAEAQLSSRQADLDALTAQRTYLSQQVAMSTVSVTIAQPDSSEHGQRLVGAIVAVLVLMGATGVVVGLLVSRRYRRRQRPSSPTA